MRLLNLDYFKGFEKHAESVSVLMSLIAVFAVCQMPVLSFPEFQEYSEKHSGRSVDCAMCHASADGPIGDHSGQLGGLSPADMEKVNQVRVAMTPGLEANSPILNKFGNQIIQSLGVPRFLELKSDPAKLAIALGNKSDLDGDGIPDSTEYLDGTDPLNKFSGNPGLLFIINFNRYKIHILLAVIATSLLAYGIVNILKIFAPVNESKPNSSETTDSDVS